jgi:hypothetical protein
MHIYLLPARSFIIFYSFPQYMFSNATKQQHAAKTHKTQVISKGSKYCVCYWYTHACPFLKRTPFITYTLYPFPQYIRAVILLHTVGTTRTNNISNYIYNLQISQLARCGHCTRKPSWSKKFRAAERIIPSFTRLFRDNSQLPLDFPPFVEDWACKGNALDPTFNNPVRAATVPTYLDKVQSFTVNSS